MAGRRCDIAAAALACAILSVSPAFAIPSGIGVTQLVVDTWTTADGLPQDRVQAIGQTRDGLLWVGTEAGLARFDGHRFLLFAAPSVPELRNQSITAVYGTSDGALLVGTGSGFVIRILDGQISVISWPAGTGPFGVMAFTEDHGGGVWVGTTNGVYRVEGNRLLPVVAGIGSVLALDHAPDGVLWFGGRNGLFRWEKGRLYNFGKADGYEWGRVTHVRVGPDGTVWVAMRSSGLVSYKDGRWRTFGSAGDFLGNLARAVLVDRDGQVWAGTWNGLARVEGQGFSSWLTASGRMPSAIEALFEDREGAIWVGTIGGGLYRIRQGAVTSHTVDQGLPRDDALAMCMSRDGRLVVGVGDIGAVERTSRGWARVSGPDAFLRTAVWACAVDPAGDMWFATGEGLFRRHGERVEHLPLPGPDPEALVSSVFAAANGDVWIAIDELIFRRVHGQTSWEPIYAGKGIDVVLADAPDAGVWLGGDDGLFTWRRGTLTHAWRAPSPAHAPVSMLVERNGTAWVGTLAAGLLRYRNGQATLFGRAAGLPDLAVATVLDDGHGFLWLGTHAGLVRISKARLDTGTDTTRLDPIAYTLRDGLRSHYTDERGQPAGIVAPDGRLWIGTTRGIIEIDPSRLPERARPTGVFVDDVSVDDRPLTSDGVAPPGRGSLLLRFSCSANISSSHQRFRYRLEGFDSDWVESTRRTAIYTNVPPGRYRFIVGAADETADWGPDEASVTFELSPHWYQTWWMTALSAAVVLGCGAAIPLFRARKARRAADRLARVVDERTADLRGEVEERRRAEDELRASEARYRTLAVELEDRVRQRTAALEAEMAERMYYEQEILLARDAAEAGARAKSAFLASMSHELRTPLNAVIGYTEILQEEAAQRGLTGFGGDLAKIHGAGRHLLALVSEVLDLARIEAGRVKLAPMAFDVQGLVTEVVDAVSTVARRNGNVLRRKVHPGVSVMTADVLRLKQVLLNLLSNACKFTTDGSIVLEVLQEGEGDQTWTTFSVRDTGIGIARADLPRLFSEFSQVHAPGVGPEGAGLGLAISRRLCLLMSGTITVESEPGKGTAFTVRLPTHASGPSEHSEPE